MGRKIPGRKHRGVKDPEKQREVRDSSLKDKINAPPKNLEQEEIPQSLQRIIEFREKVRNGEITLKRKRKKNKCNVISSESKSRTKSILKSNGAKLKKDSTPSFIQQKDEPDKMFLRRIHETVKEVIKEAHFESKYGVKINKNYETGEVEVIKQPKDELVELIKKAKKEEKNKGKKKKKSVEPRLTKSQKRQKKLAEKKLRKSIGNEHDFSDYKDDVQFGDIVHAPPTLITPKRVISSNCAPRPGQKNLLLKTVLKNNSNQEKCTNKSVHFKQGTKEQKKNSLYTNGKIDKTARRRDLPAGLRRQLDLERDKVIAKYKLMKAQNIFQKI